MKAKLLRLTIAGLAVTSLLLMAAGCGPSPTTEAPATEAPVATEAPATEAPAATEAPPTEVPPTEVPPTEAPAAPTVLDRPFITLAADVVFSMDPAEDWSFGGGAGVLLHAYETLLTYEGEDFARIKPVLAAEIPTKENGGISEDGKTITWHLKPDMTFHDGTPINSEAIKYSVERQIALAFGPDFYFQNLDSITIVDDLTFEMHLKEPSSMFMSVVASPWATRIANPTLCKEHEVDGDWGHAWVAEHDAGSGPYIIESWDRDAQQIKLVKYENYWGGWEEGKGIEEVIVRWVTEPSTVRALLETGDADLASSLTAEDWAELSATDEINGYAFPSTLLMQIYLNNEKPPTDNKLVRQALKASFDAETIIDGVLGGLGLPMDSWAPPAYAGVSKPSNYIGFDLDHAQELLAEAGYPDGFEFTVKDPGLFQNSSLVLEVWQADLAKIGVTMHIEPVDQGQFYTALLTDPPDVPVSYLSNMGPDFPDAWSAMWYEFSSDFVAPGCCNYSNYANPRIDELIAEAEQEFDAKSRDALYAEAFEILEDDVPMLTPLNFMHTVAMRDYVQGYHYVLALSYQYVPYEEMWIK